MKMTERDVIKNYRSLSGLGGLALPSKLSFAISYNLEKLQRESERIEKERKRLCVQYADKNESGEPVMVDSVINGEKTQEYKMTVENRKLFGEEYDAVLDSEVEIDIRTVKQEVVERCEQAERYNLLTVAQLLVLSFMLEE